MVTGEGIRGKLRRRVGAQERGRHFGRTRAQGQEEREMTDDLDLLLADVGLAATIERRRTCLARK